MKLENQTLINLGVRNNLNNRIYEDNDNLRECIKDFNDRVDKYGKVYGQLGHPDRFDTHFLKVSHTIKNVRVEEDKVVGDIEILKTPSGEILQEMIDDGLDYAITSRAAGSTNEDGTVTIKKIFSFDFVTNNVPFEVKWKSKESKRIFNDLDPYGEENWEE